MQIYADTHKESLGLNFFSPGSILCPFG